ncbi:MAG: acetate/propionate family kinase [Planctomycetota bacterium]
MYLLLLNAGSSSLKGALVQLPSRQPAATATAEWSGDQTKYQWQDLHGTRHRGETRPWRDHVEAFHGMVKDLLAAPVQPADILAVGHRVVHGGRFDTAVKITPAVRQEIEAVSEQAPLHNPASLATIDAAQAALPRATHIATFDTCFHRTLPPEAATYPLPRQWTEDWGIRRHGFHGLSHEYCLQRTAELMQQPADGLKLITCHLGHGCSAAAISAGRCIDTTMGFTPLEGLMMASRCGDVDAGAILWVQQAQQMTAKQVEQVLCYESGLLGISGVSADMRAVLAASDAGNERARLAIQVYVHRLRKAIGGLFATLGGADALVFTAGVGENSPPIRAQACERLAPLGIEIDPARNRQPPPDSDISTDRSAARVFVLAAREDLTMVQQMAQLLKLAT